MKSSRGEDGWISWRDSLAFGSCRYNGKKDVRDLEEGSTILTHLYVSRNRTSCARPSLLLLLSFEIIAISNEIFPKNSLPWI